MLQPSLFRDYPTVLRRIAMVSVGVLVLGIIGYRVYALMRPPTLLLEQPTDYLSTTSRTIIVRGVTVPGAVLTINGRTFVPDQRGGFSAELVLLPGTNTIELEAKMRHSRAARIIRRIQVTSADAPVA